MINKDFKVDFKNKKILYKSHDSGEKYTRRELYSFLQDLFDNPENMKYEVPMQALSKTKFKFINGWEIDKEALKHLR